MLVLAVDVVCRDLSPTIYRKRGDYLTALNIRTR